MQGTFWPPRPGVPGPLRVDEGDASSESSDEIEMIEDERLPFGARVGVFGVLGDFPGALGAECARPADEGATGGRSAEPPLRRAEDAGGVAGGLFGLGSLPMETGDVGFCTIGAEYGRPAPGVTPGRRKDGTDGTTGAPPSACCMVRDVLRAGSGMRIIEGDCQAWSTVDGTAGSGLSGLRAENPPTNDPSLLSSEAVGGPLTAILPNRSIHSSDS